MSAGSSIEWTEATWNPVAGCTPVSPGCLNCYAAKMAHRLEAMGQSKYRGLTVLHNDRRTFNGEIAFDDDALSIPLHWKKPRRIFVNSMSDLFHYRVPFEFVDKVFAVMALCPQHTFQVLTKRPERMSMYLNDRGANVSAADPIRNVINADFTGKGDHRGALHMPLPNVWLGTSVENQAMADARIPHLLRCPAAVRFLSCEPLLENIRIAPHFHGWIPDGDGCFEDLFPHLSTKKRGSFVDWVIVGGESGPRSRLCDVAWIRSIVSQCKAAGVACFVKQLGAASIQHCSQCGKNAGNCAGGMVDACGPTHAALAQECFRIRDSKGGNPGEWPRDLDVRQFPNKQGVPQ